MATDDEYDSAPLEPDSVNKKSELLCPNCLAKLEASAVLCVACGYHLASRQVLSTRSEPTPDEPVQEPGPEELRQRKLDLIARCFGWSWLAVPAGHLMILALRLAGSGEFNMLLDTSALVVTGFIGFLGVIVGRNGASFGKEANSARIHGLVIVAIGVVLCVIAGALMVTVTLVSSLKVVAILGMLAFASGIAGIMFGTAGVAVAVMGTRISQAAL